MQKFEFKTIRVKIIENVVLKNVVLKNRDGEINLHILQNSISSTCEKSRKTNLLKFRPKIVIV